MDWRFTEHAKERIVERYHLHPVSDVQKICNILNTKDYMLVKETVKDNVIIQVVLGDKKIHLVTDLKTRTVLTSIPKIFQDEQPSIKKMKSQINKFMEQEINVQASIAKEVNARMRIYEDKVNVIMKRLHLICLKQDGNNER